MKLLLDMGLAQSTARFLRNQGHDAIHLREQGLQRLPDTEIVAKALLENRAIATHDLDFGQIVALSGEQAPSVITFRLTDMRAGVVNHYLLEVIQRFEYELREGALISVTDQGIRLRLLPT